MSRTDRKRKGSLQRGLLIALCVILALILAVLIAATVWLESTLGKINRVEREDIKDDPLYEEMLQNGQVIDSDEVINILLIGQDRRDGEGRQRSDAMIMCTVNMKTKTLTMTSFMRDMYVEIPGYGSDRINACYQIGGMPLLDKCLLANFGVVIDANIEVDFDGFMGVIDTVGGVDIELTYDEANYLNTRGNWDVDNSTAGQWSLKEGMNHLTGEQALAYSRIRYIGNADFGRTDRQRKVLSALMDKCSSMNVGQLNKLLQQVLPLLTTDMDDSQIMAYASQLFPVLSKLKVDTLRIPADGAYYDDTISGMSVLVPDLEENKALLSEVIQN